MVHVGEGEAGGFGVGVGIEDEAVGVDEFALDAAADRGGELLGVSAGFEQGDDFVAEGLGLFADGGEIFWVASSRLVRKT